MITVIYEVSKHITKDHSLIMSLQYSKTSIFVAMFGDQMNMVVVMSVDILPSLNMEAVE